MEEAWLHARFGCHKNWVSEFSSCYKVLAFASYVFSILESMKVTLWYYFLYSPHKQILYVLNFNSFNCLDNVSELQKPYSIIMTAQTWRTYVISAITN